MNKHNKLPTQEEYKTIAAELYNWLKKYAEKGFTTAEIIGILEVTKHQFFIEQYARGAGEINNKRCAAVIIAEAKKDGINKLNTAG